MKLVIRGKPRYTKYMYRHLRREHPATRRRMSMYGSDDEWKEERMEHEHHPYHRKDYEYHHKNHRRSYPRRNGVDFFMLHSPVKPFKTTSRFQRRILHKHT